MPSGTLILGIETSCDETAAAVVEAGTLVRANVIASQARIHAPYGGVVPELASRAHAERLLPVVRHALDEAGCALADVAAIAVGHRPGLIGSLLVGLAAAKALAWALNRPLIGVDHVQAHLYASLLHRPGSPPPLTQADAWPALGLVVSGGHTVMYRCDSPVDLTRLGATLDDALGEAFDKAATILGLGYPGGPEIDRLARTPGADDRAYDFPVALRRHDSLDFSFSGLKTSLLYAVRGLPLPGGQFERDHHWLSEMSRADLAASFQRAAVEAVIYKLERAWKNWSQQADCPCRALLTGGGVCANSRLRVALTEFASRHGLRLGLPDPEFCLDNAAMIAGLAYHLLHAGRCASLDLQAEPTPAC